MERILLWVTIVSLMITLASHLDMLYNIIKAKFYGNWQILLDFNRFNEGNIEFYFFAITSPIIFFAIFYAAFRLREACD